jgi:hypothetical protein
MKQELKECEDHILYRLSASNGSLVDDIDLVTTLEASRAKSGKIKVWYPQWKINLTVHHHTTTIH